MGFFKPNVQKMLNKQDVRGLIKALRYSDSKILHKATLALIQIGLPTIKLLIAAIKNKETQVRAAAASALGEIGDPQAVGPLIDTLKNTDAEVRTSAARALVKIGAPTVRPLIDTLKDTDAEVRTSAARALVKIGAPTVRPLIDTLKDTDAEVRTSAARALGEIGDPQAVGPLIDALLIDRSDNVVVAAAGALDNLGWQPDIGKTGAAYWIANGQWKKCIEIGLPAVAWLTSILQNDYFSVWRRLACYSALEQIRGIDVFESDVQKLVELVAERMRFLYSRTSIVKTAISDPAGTSALMVVGYEYVDEPDPDIKGIYELKAVIPDTLRDRVYALSGEAKVLLW